MRVKCEKCKTRSEKILENNQKKCQINMFNSWLIKVIVGLICFILIYQITANMLLQSDYFKRSVNRRPERNMYHWDTAWTIIPGVIRVKNYQMSVMTQSNTWHLTIDSARFSLNPVGLLKRSVRIGNVRSSGVSFKLDSRNNQKIISAIDDRIITDTINSNREIFPGNTRIDNVDMEDARPQWRISIGKATIKNLYSLEINDYKWSGTGRVSGSFCMITRDVMHVRHVEACLEQGAIDVHNETVSDNMSLQIAARLGPFVPRDNRGALMLNYLESSVLVKGDFNQLEFAKQYIGDVDWFDINGKGYLQAELCLDNGLFCEDTSILFRSEDIVTEVKGWLFEGSGILNGSIVRIGQDLHSTLDLHLGNASVQHSEKSDEPFQIPNLNATFQGKNIRIADDDPDVTIQIEIPQTIVNDLSRYNVFFPDSGGFEILPESECILQAHLSATQTGVSAKVRLHGQNNGIRLGQQDFRGDFDLQAHLKTTDPDFDVFHMQDMFLKLRNVHDITSAASGYGWSGSLVIPETTVKTGTPVEISSEVEIGLSHSKPVSNVFSSGQRHWFEDYIHFEDLTGKAHLDINPEVIRLSKVSLAGTGVVSPEYGINPFAINASSTEIDFNKGISGLNLNFNIPHSVIPDLSVVNDYFPKTGAIAIKPGRTGLISASVNISNNEGIIELDLAGNNTHFWLFDEYFRGDPMFRIRLNTNNILGGVFQMDGSQFSLKNVDCIEKDCEVSWWSDVQVKSGTVKIGKPLTGNGKVELHMRDTGPILALFQDESRAVRWLGDILLIRNIAGNAQMQLNADGMRINDLVLEGDNLLLRAKLLRTVNLDKGILYVRFRGLSLGIEMENGERSYKFINPRRWYDRYNWPD